MRTSFRHQSEAQPPNGPLTAAASPDTPSHMPATQSGLPELGWKTLADIWRADYRAADNPIGIEQEQDRSASRGCTAECKAGGQSTAVLRGHGMAEFDQRADKHKRI